MANTNDSQQDDLTPQTQANIAAGNDAIFIQTGDRRFIVLTSDLAMSIGEKLPVMVQMSKGLPCAAPQTTLIPS